MQHSNVTVEAYAGMADQLAIDLAIEEALQDEIKYIKENKNQSYVDLCDLSDKEKKRKRLNFPLHMIWDGRRDHMVKDATPLAGMPSSFVGEARGSLELSSIPRPAGSFVLKNIEEKK